MMRCWILTFLCLFSVCAQAKEPAEYVLVWQNAWLQQAPRADAGRVRELAFPDSERATRGVEARVFRLLGERGDWAEVEIVQDPDLLHCVGPLYDLSAFRLRFFVRSRDLVPVLNEEFKQTYSDGTGLRLKEGLPLSPDDRAGYHRIRFDGLEFAVDLPSAKVGSRYRPANRIFSGCPARWNPEGSRLSFDSGKPVKLDKDRHVCLEEAGSKRWRLRGSCVEMELRARPRPKLWEGDPPMAGMLGALRGGGGGAGYSLRQGAAIFWPDGELAGRMSREHWLPEKTLGAVGESGLRCTTRQLTASGRKSAAPESERSLRLCFRPTDLVESKRSDPMQGLSAVMAEGGKGLRGAGWVEAERKSQVEEGSIAVKGSLSREAIRRVIRRSRKSLRYCYEKVLQRQPGLSGKVRVNLTIGAEGKVISANLAQSDLPQQTGLEGCVLRVVRSMRFPKPEGGGLVVVTYPFIFKTPD